MSTTWRGWRFDHPDLDEGPGHGGLSLGPTGAILTCEGEAAVRQSLIVLLTTRPGERVMRPQLGCDLQRLVFAPNDATTAGLAIHYVRRAVEQFEPRVVLQRVDANPHPDDPSRLVVELDYTVKRTGQTSSLQLEVDLAGGR
ncbi:MAG TPA: GPW/gp25 family protein [Acidimicrobiales bacterium]|nr:GPW/gp25 family protein [Acidimicrobiales bacterium]